MVVTRYLGPHLRDLLDNSRLKISKVSQLNDPFEFRYRHVGGFGRTTAKRMLRERLRTPDFFKTAQESPELMGKSKQAIKRLINSQRKHVLDHLIKGMPKSFEELGSAVAAYADATIRIICFSNATQKPLEEILLWSHYTSNHTGVRIWIDLSREPMPLRKTFNVEYREELPAVENKNMITLHHYESVIQEAMSVKARCWQYEDEVRSFIPREFFLTEEVNGMPLDFVKIDLRSIVRIDFGVRHNEKDRDGLIAQVATSIGKEIKFSQAMCSHDRYELKYLEL